MKLKIEKGSMLLVAETQREAVEIMAVIPDAKGYLVSASWDGEVCLLDVQLRQRSRKSSEREKADEKEESPEAEAGEAGEAASVLSKNSPSVLGMIPGLESV